MPLISPIHVRTLSFICLLSTITAYCTSFAPVCRKYQRAVGVVAYELVDKDGQPFSYEDENIKVETYTTIGTAFAIGPKQFVTNGHVMDDIQHGKANTTEEIADALYNAHISKGVESLKEKTIAALVEAQQKENAGKDIDDDVEIEYEIDEDELREAYCKANAQELEELKAKLLETYKDVHVGAVRIILSHSFGKKLTIAGVQFHPSYENNTTENDELMTNGERDLAILTIEEETDIWFTLADLPTVYDLCQGEEIGVLGFPMEGLASDGGLNIKAPEATFKRGSIGKITTATYDFSEDATKNRTIFHDVPISGGSSGSPIFLSDGRVIGVIWGGNSISPEDDEEGTIGTINNPTQQNMAVRIDTLEEIRSQAVEPINVKLK